MKFFRSQIFSGLVSLSIGVDWIRIVREIFGEFVLNEVSIIGILFVIDGGAIIFNHFQKKQIYNKIILGVSACAIILLLVPFISGYLAFNDIWLSLFVAIVDCYNSYSDLNFVHSGSTEEHGDSTKTTAVAGAVGAIASELIRHSRKKKTKKYVVNDEDEDNEENDEELEEGKTEELLEENDDIEDEEIVENQDNEEEFEEEDDDYDDDDDDYDID